MKSIKYYFFTYIKLNILKMFFLFISSKTLLSLTFSQWYGSGHTKLCAMWLCVFCLITLTKKALYHIF